MCGILGIINARAPYIYDENFCNGTSRGPEYSSLRCFRGNIVLGFHRLSINGLDSDSDQPLEIDNIVLVCNGEIYNYKELYQLIDEEACRETDSDCEIIIHLYKKYGIEQTLQMLDGEFSFILIDINLEQGFVARDPYGVRPLYHYKKDTILMYTSELKMINSHISQDNQVHQFEPGTFMKLNLKKWLVTIEYKKKFSNFPFSYSSLNSVDEDIIGIMKQINYNLREAVRKRITNTDREVCCLLSGGLDSSLVCSIAQEFSQTPIKTFSIGLKDSIDLINAKKVAEYIKSEHHEVIVSDDEFFNAIPEVIHAIESYDTTTVRASVGNYLISKYIRDNTNCKVVLNGDGADELSGGYLYFSNCIDPIEFDKECKRLLNDICYFDVLRSDRSISCNGIEARIPFLDITFVQHYLSISTHLRCDSTNERMEKFLIRMAFNYDNLLPDEILWRRKEAFSDGVSGVSGANKSWSEIIKEKINQLPDEMLSNINKEYDHNNPTTTEQQYYRYLFEQHYRYCEKTIPYLWMPKYVNADDSSARTLSIYKPSV